MDTKIPTTRAVLALATTVYIIFQYLEDSRISCPYKPNLKCDYVNIYIGFIVLYLITTINLIIISGGKRTTRIPYPMLIKFIIS